MTVADMCDPVEEKQIAESILGIDDVSGEPLDPSLIRKARHEEMRGFEERQVYHHVLRSVAQADPEGKFIGVRWVDVNWLVKHLLMESEGMISMPRLHHWLQLVSCCLRVGVEESEGPVDHRILLLDIKKAFLHCKVSRNVYIEQPAEDPMSEGRHLVGKLDKAMYGTRDAPAEWPAELERTMIKLGFRQVVSTPCLFYHSSLDVLGCWTCR